MPSLKKQSLAVVVALAREFELSSNTCENGACRPSTGRKLTPAVKCVGQKPAACNLDSGINPSAVGTLTVLTCQETWEKQRDMHGTARPSARGSRPRGTSSTEPAEGPRGGAPRISPQRRRAVETREPQQVQGRGGGADHEQPD
uniref:Uncharacterized protein n=1 Tax=Knipowitschia caucasica TaxID=637954 RepID=A0AAV2JDE1_KNICA